MPLSEADQNKYRQVVSAAREVLAGRLRAPVGDPKRGIVQPQHRLTPEGVKGVAADYRSSLSLREVSIKWGINRETATLALRRAGEAVRKRGEARPRHASLRRPVSSRMKAGH